MMRVERFVVPVLVVTALAVFVHQRWARPRAAESPVSPAVGTPGGPSTSREDLASAIRALDARVASDPSDGAAASRLADALLRQARVNGHAGLAIRAEAVLRRALRSTPGHYETMRMLGSVLLTQHRFRDAIEAAEQAMRLQPRDAWNYGIVGDGALEVGDYERAFAAFDRMMALRPSAAAYARVSYAKEISGDLDGALRLMQMALEATSAHDPESQAWHHVQIGDLHLHRGSTGQAEREYRHADHVYPGYPLAIAGIARVQALRGDHRGALALYEQLMAESPLPALAARIGELHERLGNASEAERHYALAEHGWRYDTPEPAELVRFLATHDRRVDEALAIAEREAATRRDIQTMDALAWAAFKADRLELAVRASREAVRTGTRDAIILEHARAIAERAASPLRTGAARAG
jgi:tetratricopeptide (TPR) repeat protein